MKDLAILGRIQIFMILYFVALIARPISGLASSLNDNLQLNGYLSSLNQAQLRQLNDEMLEITSHLSIEKWSENTNTEYTVLKNGLTERASLERTILPLYPLTFPQVKKMLFPDAFDTSLEVITKLFGQNMTNNLKKVMINSTYFGVNHAQHRLVNDVLENFNIYALKVQGFSGVRRASHQKSLVELAKVSRQMGEMMKSLDDPDEEGMNVLKMSVEEGEKSAYEHLYSQFGDANNFDIKLNVMLTHRLMWFKCLSCLTKDEWGLTIADLLPSKTQDILNVMDHDYHVQNNSLNESSSLSSHSTRFKDVIDALILRIEEEIITKTPWDIFHEETEATSRMLREKFEISVPANQAKLLLSDSPSEDEGESQAKTLTEDISDQVHACSLVPTIASHSGQSNEEQEQAIFKCGWRFVEEIDHFSNSVKITKSKPDVNGLIYAVTIFKGQNDLDLSFGKRYQWRGKQLKLIRRYQDEKATCPLHKFSKQVDCLLDYAHSTTLRRDRAGFFLWLPGKLKISQGNDNVYEETGRFEYCVDHDGQVFHRLFRPLIKSSRPDSYLSGNIPNGSLAHQNR